MPAHPPPAGLCADCAWARVVRTARGSAFLRCGRSDEDPRYPKYPPLPVRRCDGFEQTDAERDDNPSSGRPDV